MSSSGRHMLPARVWMTIAFAVAIWLLISMNLVSCVPAKDSHKLFMRPKYEMNTRTKPRNGVPSVRQDWWEDRWFWQRRNTPYPIQERP